MPSRCSPLPTEAPEAYAEMWGDVGRCGEIFPLLGAESVVAVVVRGEAACDVSDLEAENANLGAGVR